MAGDAPNRMYELLRMIEQINRVAMTMPGLAGGVFAPVSLEIPKLAPPELGCMRVVSRLFVQHFEAGKIGTAFLEARGDVYGHDPEQKVKRHRLLTQQLRTFFQHNLDSKKPQDRDIVEGCERWFRENCGTAVPSTDEHWGKCLSALLAQAQECFEILLKTLRSIEADESCLNICREWELRIKRHHPPHMFDELIAKVAVDMGRDGIDASSLRKRHYDSWQKHMSLLQDGVDFEAEARKLIEYSILNLAPKVLPVTGKDLMEEFGLGPGPMIGQLLTSAQQLYEAEPCSREDLLQRLRIGVLPNVAASVL
ncbi:MAG: hypothetical protein AAB403_22855 [Planctomycetota bacterium]